MSGLRAPIDFPQQHGRPGLPGVAGPAGAAGAVGPAGAAGINANMLSAVVDIVALGGLSLAAGGADVATVIPAVAGKIIGAMRAVLVTIGVVGTNTGAPILTLRYRGSVDNLATGMATGIGSTGTLVSGARQNTTIGGNGAIGTDLVICNTGGSSKNGTWNGTSVLTIFYELVDPS